MVILPFKLNEYEYSIFVVLQDENLDRLKSYDPAEVNVVKMGGAWALLRVREVFIGYATDADLNTVTHLLKNNKIQEALKFLSRGFVYHPALGDNDKAYVPAPRRSNMHQFLFRYCRWFRRWRILKSFIQRVGT